jgi:hypothetical protein
MTIYPIQPITLGGVHTYPLATRKSKVSVREFARPVKRGTPLVQFLDALPAILAAQDLRELSSSIQRARARKRAIVWGIGGHVIKVGLGPVLIDLMQNGFVSGVAMNGAALIHDFEIAMVGNTSEDVDAALGEGQFGMAQETGFGINEIAKLAHRLRMGYGEAAGQYLTSGILAPRYPEMSVLVRAYRQRIPVTIHIAIGTDIPHMHPAADGAALGDASHHDFRLFCALVQQMDAGGIYLNWGSAVILPEVFLKAVSVVRNLGVRLRPITTANFDFIQHYRPRQNVVTRPVAASKGAKGAGSKGYAITGHHELLLPLLAAALVSGWPTPRKRATR